MDSGTRSDANLLPYFTRGKYTKQMNPLILNKSRRRDRSPFEGGVDWQLLNQINERCKAAQERLAATVRGSVSPGDELWALVYEDIPALLRNLEAPH